MLALLHLNVMLYCKKYLDDNEDRLHKNGSARKCYRSHSISLIVAVKTWHACILQRLCVQLHTFTRMVSFIGT
jgi:hypothetical protein